MYIDIMYMYGQKLCNSHSNISAKFPPIEACVLSAELYTCTQNTEWVPFKINTPNPV